MFAGRTAHHIIGVMGGGLYDIKRKSMAS